MAKTYYAVEIFTDETGLTNVNFGIVNGVFRFITDRPNYTQQNPPYYGQAEIDINGDPLTGAVSVQFYQGFLQKKAISKNPSRSIDITSLGTYSTDNKFSFTVRNNDPFWYFCKVNGIEFTGRTVVLWAVIDNVFYQLSRGRVANNPYNEADFTFDIEDEALYIHKNLPPRNLTVTALPDSPDTQQGDPIPSVFGKVAKSKILKQQTENTFLDLSSYHLPINSSARTFYPFCPAWTYEVDTNHAGPFRLYLYTQYLDGTSPDEIKFVANDSSLVGSYLSVMKGQNADTNQLYKIIGNDATILCPVGTGYVTAIYLDTPLLDNNQKLIDIYDTIHGQRTHVFFDNYAIKPALYPLRITNDNTWWFKISPYRISCFVSTNNILSYQRDSGQNIQLYVWDSSTNSYQSLSSLVDLLNSEDGLALKLIANQATINGKVQKFDIINMAGGLIGDDTQIHGSISVINTGLVLWQNTSNQYTDKNRTNGLAITEFQFVGLGPPPVNESYLLQFDFKLTKPAVTYDKIYLCVDIQLYSVVGNISIYFTKARAKLIDVYGQWYWSTIATAQPDPIPLANIVNGNINFIPDNLLKIIGTDTGNRFGFLAQESTKQTFRDTFIVDKDFIYNREDAAMLVFGLGIYNTGLANTSFYVKVKEMALVGERQIDTITGDIYATVNGETVKNDGITPTDNVYNVFRHILEGYDSISSKLIDYGTLSTDREDWIVGRTLTEQKNSIEYLTELASHSFVGIFTSRRGKRTLRVFQDFAESVPVWTHDDDIIIRGSIERFEKTSINQLYNSIFVQYNYDEGSGKYLRAFNISHIDDENGFPLESDVYADPVLGNIPKWWLYLGGLTDSHRSYDEAKILWDICHDSYLQNKTQRQAQNDSTKLDWFIDSELFDSTDTTSTGDTSAAFKFLSLFVQWATLQKYVVTYSIPLNNETVFLELLDVITFKDTIFTHGIEQVGWITGIEIDTEGDRIKLQAILLPPEVEENVYIQASDVDGAKVQNSDIAGDKKQNTDI